MNEQDHIIDTFTEMASRYESLMNSELNRFWGVSYLDFVQELINEIDFGSHQSMVGLDLTFEMLSNAKEQIRKNNRDSSIQLVCASAHAMPFQKHTFDIAICCLATHHMNTTLLLNNIYSLLKPNGKFHIADVGGSKRWKIGIIRTFIKVFAFTYFMLAENLSRARAESGAIANVITINEWRELIVDQGFISIKARELKSKRFWAPNPVIIEAKKQWR